MAAVDPPAIVAPAPDQNQSDVIEVIGRRADRVQKIDRRTYQVQETPHAAQKDAVQLLRGLPAVTVTSDGTVMLLGSGGVQIFVDGRPYQGDQTQYLRTLHGSDIERIEIITNPSAQYSSEGVGGIINLVLRRKAADGVSGNLSGEASTPGHGSADATIKYRKGRWTYEAELQGGGGRAARTHYDKLRSVEGSAGGKPTTDDERGRQSARDTAAYSNAKVSYEVDPRTNVSAKLEGGYYRNSTVTTADFVGLTLDFRSFSERRRRTLASSFVVGQLTLDHKGKKEGDTLTGEVDVFGRPGGWRDRSLALFSDGGALATDRHQALSGVYGQIDWQHVIGRRILSIGGTLSSRQQTEAYRVASTGLPGVASGGDAADRYHSMIETVAAYATFQQPIGSWTVMPGIRVEQNKRTISSAGAPVVGLDHWQVFPTLHVDHRFGKALDLTLSYSKRIDRAQPEMLRPYRAVEDILTGIQGNPHLRDQSTDAYEINLHYHRKTVEAGMILYDRETSRLWSTNYATIGTGTVYSWINAGRRSDRGAEFDLATPIVKHVKFNESLNLFDERGPVDATNGMSVEDRFRYTANTTLEWDGADRGKTPGDVAQLQWTYSSPSSQFQQRNLGSNWLNLSFTHNFSRTISLTGTAIYLTSNRHRLFAPTVQEYYAQSNPAQFKLKLLKTFGKR
jgi:hypothetical protein